MNKWLALFGDLYLIASGIINGQAKGFFRSTKGVRQGDSLSPKLFTNYYSSWICLKTSGVCLLLLQDTVKLYLTWLLQMISWYLLTVLENLSKDPRNTYLHMNHSCYFAKWERRMGFTRNIGPTGKIYEYQVLRQNSPIW